MFNFSVIDNIEDRCIIDFFVRFFFLATTVFQIIFHFFFYFLLLPSSTIISQILRSSWAKLFFNRAKIPTLKNLLIQ